MSKYILAKSIDTSFEYDVIGLDLAKNSVTAALLTSDGELIGIDRLSYEDLIQSAKELSPTTFSMEPCCEMNMLVNELEDWGHRCVVIGGKNVKNYIETHFSGQKTDLNDAMALALLASDRHLPTICSKDPEQMKFASLTTIREQYIKQYRQSIVALKGVCQSWMLNISKGISGKAKLTDLIEGHPAFPQAVKEELVRMVKHAAAAQKSLNAITKRMTAMAKEDEVCKAVQGIPGIGPICACRLKATLGDIKRFEHPKDLPAYYGLVPRSRSTGHNENKGKITKRGDKLMRALLVQGAGSVILMANNGTLRAKALSKWILKKQREKMPWGKLTCAVAAKLLRIVRAILISNTPYDPKKAGVAKCSLPKPAA